MGYQSADPLISIKNLSFRRGNKVIFDNISLEITRGMVTAIMGPSGTGKTTLLKLISGQLQPQQGSILVDGEPVRELSKAKLFELRKRMGMLFQSGALLTDLTVFENVAFPLREHTDLSESIIRILVLMRLQSVGLRGAHKLHPNELSGGMARRVALARAIVLDPMMIMYDEPFAGQDPISMGVLVKMIKEINELNSLSSIIVSHDISDTLSIADYVFIISEGKVEAQGTPDEIKQSDSPWVEQFLLGLPDGPAPFHYPAPPLLDELVADL